MNKLQQALKELGKQYKRKPLTVSKVSKKPAKTWKILGAGWKDLKPRDDQLPDWARE